jgi:hypothetical protein
MQNLHILKIKGSEWEMMEKEIKLKLELMVIAAKIVKLELNKYHLKKVTELTNQIWSCENIENHFNYFMNELKQDYKFYKKFYKKIEEVKEKYRMF